MVGGGAECLSLERGTRQCTSVYYTPIWEQFISSSVSPPLSTLRAETRHA